MANVSSVMEDLKFKASEKTRNIYIRHGAPAARTLGVSNADMKGIAKTIKKQQALACKLYDTGVFEAMYLAGMVADGAQLSGEQLQSWAKAAAGMAMIYEYTVPWVALESIDPHTVALDWIASTQEHIAAAGWCTYSGIVATTPDDEINLPTVKTLLQAIPAWIHTAPNHVRSTMNGFVIAVGTYIIPLLKQTTATAKEIGIVTIDVGDTACEVPNATDRIAKAQASGRAGFKRKTMRC